jgi:hypothetical protein
MSAVSDFDPAVVYGSAVTFDVYWNRAQAHFFARNGSVFRPDHSILSWMMLSFNQKLKIIHKLEHETEEARYATAIKNATMEAQYAQYVAALKAHDEKDYEEARKEWYKFYEARGAFAPGLPLYPSFTAITYTDPMSLMEWKTLSDAGRVAKIAEVSA